MSSRSGLGRTPGRDVFARRFLPAWLVLLLGLSGAGPLFWFVQQRETDHTLHQFEAQSSSILRLLEREIDATAEVLRTIESLRPAINASSIADFPPESRTAIRQFANNSMQRRHGLVAIGFAGYVPSESRNAFEEAFRPPKHNLCSIVEPDGVGFTCADSRATYYPTLAIDPPAQEPQLLGLDAGFDTVRREALERAIASGEIVVSRATRLIEAQGAPDGVIMALPMYAKTLPADAGTEQRSAATIGVLLAMVRLDLLAQVAASEAADGPISFTIEDVTSPVTVPLLTVGPPTVSSDGPRWSAASEVGGCTWLFSFVAGPGYGEGKHSWTPWLLSGGWLVFALLVAGYLTLIAGRTLRIARLAGERALEIAKREQVEEALRRSAARFEALVQNSSDIVLILRRDGYILYVSPSVEMMLGYQVEQLTGRNVLEFIHADDKAKAMQGLSNVLAGPGSYDPLELRVMHATGEWRIIETAATNLLHEPAVGGIVQNARDVTDRHWLEEELRHQAFYDPLTGLPNRALFMDRLNQALVAKTESDAMVAVMFLDLDGFKVINDSLGHAAGDELLEVVARRVESRLRSHETVSRFGGDEFTILLPRVAHRDLAWQVAEQILAEMSQPVRLEGREVFVSTSIGIAIHERFWFEKNAGDLLREADLALYSAKAAGKSRAVLFDPRMEANAIKRLDLETDLRQALERGELRVLYQPEYRTDSEQVVGMEALVRWQHPQRGLLSPSDFVGVAEDTGLIVPLGRWVLTEACRRARSWLDQPAAPTFVLSVNLSLRQLALPDLVSIVSEVLEETGLPPHHLRLEITETMLMDDTSAMIERLKALKALGVRLAIDDFGTGFSSLSYLQRLPVDTLKIDRSFINSQDLQTQAIVHTVTTLAHVLGMQVTVEGIETQAQLSVARSAGCDSVQGYYFSRPLTAADMAKQLRTGERQEQRAA